MRTFFTLNIGLSIVDNKDGPPLAALPPMCKAVVERLADKKNGLYHRGHGETQSAVVGGMARWPIWSWRSERTISLPAKQLGAPLERSNFWRDDSIPKSAHRKSGRRNVMFL